MLSVIVDKTTYFLLNVMLKLGESQLAPKQNEAKMLSFIAQWSRGESVRGEDLCVWWGVSLDQGWGTSGLLAVHII